MRRMQPLGKQISSRRIINNLKLNWRNSLSRAERTFRKSAKRWLRHRLRTIELRATRAGQFKTRQRSMRRTLKEWKGNTSKTYKRKTGPFGT